MPLQIPQNSTITPGNLTKSLRLLLEEALFEEAVAVELVVEEAVDVEVVEEAPFSSISTSSSSPRFHGILSEEVYTAAMTQKIPCAHSQNAQKKKTQTKSNVPTISVALDSL